MRPLGPAEALLYLVIDLYNFITKRNVDKVRLLAINLILYKLTSKHRVLRPYNTDIT